MVRRREGDGAQGVRACSIKSICGGRFAEVEHELAVGGNCRDGRLVDDLLAAAFKNQHVLVECVDDALKLDSIDEVNRYLVLLLTKLVEAGFLQFEH